MFINKQTDKTKIIILFLTKTKYYDYYPSFLKIKKHKSQSNLPDNFLS